MRSLFFTFLLIFSGACSDSNSGVDIDNGLHLNLDVETWAPGVVGISGCSATIVSQNTLISAAHCINRPGANVCVGSGLYYGNRVCTNQTYVPSSYGGGSTMGMDVFVAVFRDKPFQDFHKVAPTRIVMSGGDKGENDVTMIGYSRYHNNRPQEGSKRWGKNRIRRLANSGGERETIITVADLSFDGVGVSPGDSGGTMLNDRCELIGVTSRTSSYSNVRKENLHTNLTTPPVKEFLLETIQNNNAQICGLPGTNEAEFCSNEYLARPLIPGIKEDNGNPRFPCKSLRDAGDEVGVFPDGIGNNFTPSPNNPEAPGQSQPPENNGNQKSPDGSTPPSEKGELYEIEVKVVPENGGYKMAVSTYFFDNIKEICVLDAQSNCTKRFGFKLQEVVQSRSFFEVEGSISQQDLRYGVKISSIHQKEKLFKM